MRFRALVVAVLTMAVVVGTAGVATARVHFVPAERTVRLTGHGYGHGIGMSQYGAEGAARQGKTWRQIVDFYYPGTTVGDARGSIRVLITADTTGDVQVRPASGLSIRDIGAKQKWTLPARSAIKRWRVNPNRWVQRLEGGKWRRWRQMKGNSEFFRPGRAPVGLVLPNGQTKQYRDRLRSINGNTVNALLLESYLRGVVPLEMPASWSREALAAQAVAARTYAIRLRDSAGSRYYQICDTTSCQVYGGHDAEDRRTDTAIRSVARKVLRYRGTPALTQFSSSNGGFSADGGMPYLVSKRDPWDGWSGNPVHNWKKSISASSIESAYPTIGRLIGLNIVRREGGGQWGGRVDRLVLDGTAGNVTITGQDLRFGFGLRSHWFRPAITAIGNRWRKTGGAASRVGGTKRPEYADNKGAVQVFREGRIYWTKQTGAREVHGAILRRYLRMGGTGSRVGFPTTGERNAAVRGSRHSYFQRGRIYWHRSTGAHEVYGAILRRYVRLGAAGGRLRLPTSGEYAVKGGRASDFQGGRLVWKRATNKVSVYYN